MIVAFALYVVLFAGTVYNVTFAPAGIGNEKGKPVAFYRFNMGKQYIVEGIASALVLFLGSAGFIGLTTFGPTVSGGADALRKWKPAWWNYFSLALNAILVIVGYNMLLLFLRLKLPNYLQVAR